MSIYILRGFHQGSVLGPHVELLHIAILSYPRFSEGPFDSIASYASIRDYTVIAP